MRSLCVFACIMVAVLAQEYNTHQEYSSHEEYPQMIEYRYPDWYSQPHQRYRRELSVDEQTGNVGLSERVGDNGRAFGSLEATGNDLYGKLGYQHTLFNDDRGKLDATAYGSMVRSPYGNYNNLGGRLDWENDRAFASVDVSRQLHGPTTFDAAAGARWPIGKNGDFSVGGTYTRVGPFSNYGARAGFTYRF